MENNHTQKGRTALWPALAEELAMAFGQGKVAAPITTRGLAAQWDVSPCTMRKAVLALIQKGVLDRSRGSRIRLKTGKGSGLPEHTSEAKFCGLVRDRIRDGTYRAGDPLPKVAYFTIEEHVSAHTVAAACVRLQREGLIYKKGKSWIAGSQGRFSLLITTTRRHPSVLLLFPYSMEWYPFHAQEFLVPFSMTFTSEMQHRGVTLPMAFIQKGGTPRDAGNLPVLAGIDDIISYIKGQGDSFLGALFYCGMGELDSTVIDMQRILERGKPLVHFDSTDTMAQWAAPLVARRKNRYYRCHLDERAALRLALETLVSAGHTRIGVPWFSSSKADWVPQRMERIQEVARTMDSAPTLVCIEQKEPFWRYVDEFDLRTYRQEIEVAIEKEEPTMVAGVSSHVPFGARLMKHTPSLREILGPGRATAILSLNDLMARELYLWTTYTGTRVPGDLSIVTLDNSLTCRNIPVSTIDFGFARLGYLAAHILIGDIPVQADKDGNIPGRPMLIERGSIAAPRSSAP